MEKLKAFSVLIIAFCVLSSKKILIYNEETIVAFCFLAFVVFLFRYYGTTIQESFDERGESIKSELQNLGLGRLDALTLLFQEYQKVSLLHAGVTTVAQFTIGELATGKSQGGIGLKSVFNQQLEQRLKGLFFSKSVLEQSLPPMVATTLLDNVHLLSQRLKGKKRSASFHRQNVQTLLIPLSKKIGSKTSISQKSNSSKKRKLK